MKKFPLAVAAVWVLGSAVAFAQVTLTVSSPQSYATVSSPVKVTAYAKSNHPITGWHVYVDGVSVFYAKDVSSINTYASMPQGTHQVLIRAWDSSGAFGSDYMQLTIQGTTTTETSASTSTSSGSLPTPPSTAKVFSSIDQMSGWGSCGSSACAGGKGSSSYWMAQNQTTPSMDGSSIEFYNSGVYDNALFWKKVGANNSARNLLWDFYFRVDDASVGAVQNLEFDVFQSISGYKYMIGSQCNYSAGVWDTWNEYAYGTGVSGWRHTSIPCPKFTANVWHHVQWYVQTIPSTHSYKYVTLVVDGHAHTVNQTYKSRYVGWMDNVGVQWQLDVNSTGHGYHEWVDKAKLTVW